MRPGFLFKTGSMQVQTRKIWKKFHHSGTFLEIVASIMVCRDENPDGRNEMQTKQTTRRQCLQSLTKRDVQGSRGARKTREQKHRGVRR